MGEKPSDKERGGNSSEGLGLWSNKAIWLQSRDLAWRSYEWVNACVLDGLITFSSITRTAFNVLFNTVTFFFLCFTRYYCIITFYLYQYIKKSTFCSNDINRLASMWPFLSLSKNDSSPISKSNIRVSKGCHHHIIPSIYPHSKSCTMWRNAQVRSCICRSDS